MAIGADIKVCQRQQQGHCLPFRTVCPSSHPLPFARPGSGTTTRSWSRGQRRKGGCGPGRPRERPRSCAPRYGNRMHVKQ
jgi:hypothetical protein